ncbi:hypothetical protein [Micromonospora sagamiensis]|uniref:Uncharacterized protein n=1 Tax=Micromonospora sagamiensis TaxID=47875 RepID=A0A562WPD2_9ACTN|nr:hypothetical protein [Micromonospora sagamiensis]TWJ32046.1 hypothetical protein JD81_05615 [Micromonospora sagamiensis]BCL14897.1 hypothetical protein GCM10017556_26360 [Micromonospora sagamiensis]
MLTLVVTMILYVAGFIFLYGVIRVAVRHALEDLEVRRAEALRPGPPQERPFVPETFLAGN